MIHNDSGYGKAGLAQAIYYIATGVWSLVGIRSFQAVTGPKIDTWLVKTVGVLVTMTCVFDAAALGRPWAFGARLPFLIVWPFTMPLYIIRSRGWWGCVLLLIHVALLVAILVAVVVVVGLAHLLGR